MAAISKTGRQCNGKVKISFLQAQGNLLVKICHFYCQRTILHSHMHMHTHTHIPYTYTHACPSMISHTQMHIHLPTHTHSTQHTYATHTHTPTHTHTHTCMHTRRHARAHTHTHSNKLHGHDCTTVLTLHLTKQEANHTHPLTKIIMTTNIPAYRTSAS